MYPARIEIWELERVARLALEASTPDMVAQAIIVTTGIRARVVGTIDHPSGCLKERIIEVAWARLVDGGVAAFEEALKTAVADVRRACGGTE
jgi:hypothetical protein